MSEQTIYSDPYAKEYTSQYQTNVTPEGKQSKGLAIAALVVSIVSILFVCCGICGVTISMVALILGIVAIKQCPTKKGMSIAAIVIAAITLLITVILWIISLIGNSSYLDKLTNEIEKETGITTESLFDDEDDDDDKSSTNSTTVEVSEEGSVYINGITFNILDTVGNTGFDIEVSEDDKAELQIGLEAGDDVFGTIIGSDGSHIASVSLVNNTSSVVTDVNELSIDYIAADYVTDEDFNHTDSDISVYGGVGIGTSKADVKAAYGETDNEYSGDGGYSILTYYLMDGDLSVSFSFEDDIVQQISIGYYGD